MAELPQRPREGSPPALLFIIGTLLLGVILADSRSPHSGSRCGCLPIIALTAKAMPDDREQALAAGANDYIAKPFEVEKLVSLCRVWLRR